MNARRCFRVVAAGVVATSALAGCRKEQVKLSSVSDYCTNADKNFREGRLTAAVLDYNRAMAMAPADPRPYIGLAVLYEGVERADLSIVALEQLKAVNPRAEHLPCRLAEAHLGADDVLLARDLGKEATEAEPACPRAFSVYGIALVRYRYWDSAAKAIERAIQLAPDDAQVREVLVDIYSQQGAFGKAVAAAEEALKLNPSSARLHYKAGWALSRLPQGPNATDRALDHLRRASELNPDWFEPLAETGRILRSGGKEREARQVFERAWKLNPNVAGIAFNLAALYRKQGDARAKSMQQRFEALRGEQGRFTAQRREYNQNPNDPANALTLAKLEGRSGLYATALQRLRKALVADPTNVEALRLYVELDRRSRSGYPAYLPPGPGVGLAVD